MIDIIVYTVNHQTNCVQEIKTKSKKENTDGQKKNKLYFLNRMIKMVLQ